MFVTPHPEVLARDWLPPVVLGREAEVAEVVRRLDPPRPRAPPPWIVGVVGTSGSGTSTVARRAAREVVDRLRTSTAGVVPRSVAVRTAGQRGTHGVASALLGSLDDGFDGRGFSVVEIVAGFLRRLRRQGRPCVLVLDDLGPGGPDLGPILRAFGDPDRFLPEGECGIPSLWTVLAGTPEAIGRVEVELRGRGRIGPFVALGPYSAHALRALIEDRAERVLGRRAPPPLIERILARSIEEGGGASRAVALLRRALVGPALGGARPILRPRPGELAIPVEPWVVRAIEEVAQGNGALLAEVRASTERYARAEGAAPLPATTLWRRIVRLERAGYVRREVRAGGVGGTRSLLRVTAPVEEWVTTSPPRETRPTSSAWAVPRAEGVLPDGPGSVETLRPTGGLPPPDVELV